MLASGLTNLVATVYEAACDPSRIAPFVKDTAAYFNAPLGACCVWPVGNPDVFLPVAFGIPAAELELLFANRNEPDTLFWRLAKEPPGSSFLVEARLSTGARKIALAGLCDAGDENRCGLIVFRDTDHDSFSESEQEALQTLIDFFSRALIVNKQFVRLYAQNRTLLSLFENSERGIAIFGQRGQITFQSAVARRIFADTDCFELQDNMLRILDEDSHQRLYDFLQLARANPESTLGSIRLATRIPRGPDKLPYQILAYGLPFRANQAAFDEEESLASLLIHDPSTVVVLDVGLLQALFDFSAAEANLAQNLHAGLQLIDAAAALSISVHTARTQLRSMFKKTGVNSQSALMQKICNFPRLNPAR